ncbi:xylulokinase [Brevibacterium siliguriense]|uniref:Xylulose kinase n=1 Tax=Brevibacterium siliguriense TaxID=1136497 RepID=A0A1H1R4Q9_9MICO|nr:FGGY family carbohydrate kinase [Brevibacterium siliguriense]SDS30708.1 xylulokinase [Brevibacterium siliguriense]
MSANRRFVAGVDSSTQSCKVVIADPGSGDIIRTGSAPHPPGTEVDPEAWWTALQEAIAAAGGLDDVAGLSISGQQHGLVALDTEGRVIRDALLWNDLRSKAAARDLIAEVGAADYVARTGVLPVASFTAAKLRWLRVAESDNAARVAAVALPHDWLSWRFLGYGPADVSARGPVLDALVTDASDASGTAYFDPSASRYDLDLFLTAFDKPAREAVGLPCAADTDAEVEGEAASAIVLPRVLSPNEAAGHSPDGIVVGPGAGDNAAAALGLGVASGDLVISIGTSGTVFGTTDLTIADSTGAVAGFASADGGRLPLVATLNAARVLDSAAKLLRVSHDELAALALASQPGADGLTLVPYFEGERTPNLPDATARLEGMTLSNSSAENVARAFVEGMLCGLADGLDAVQAQGLEAGRLLLIGGAARNPAVREVARDIFTVPIDVPEQAEYVAIGAARQAAWTLSGTLPDWSVELVATLHPRPSRVRQQYRSSAEQTAAQQTTSLAPTDHFSSARSSFHQEPADRASSNQSLSDHRGSSGANASVKG